jgi:hypothetical protein
MENFSEDVWQEIIPCVRSRLFSIQSNLVVFKMALFLGKFDFMASLLRYSSDIHEEDVVKILNCALKFPARKVSKILGLHL